MLGFDPEMPQLRFEEGQRVKCRTGEHEWSVGTVVQVWYREDSWPGDRIVPYQVRLDKGPLIFAPLDVDRLIQKVVESALHKAVERKDMTDLLIILTNIAAKWLDLGLDTVDERGQTALLAATACGWNEGALALLKAGVSVNKPDDELRTPLIVAATQRNLLLAEAFLKGKADVHARDANPDADPDFSSTTHDVNSEHRSALHHAAELGDVPMVRALLKAQADPNAAETQFQTPLHLALDTRRYAADNAIKHDIEQVTDLLLEARADVNCGSDVLGETFTMLHQVARVGDDVLAIKMLAARADINRQDENLGFSPLHVAAKAKHYDMIKLLVKANADMTLTIKSGKTAADLAAVNNASQEMLELLGGSDIKVPETPSTGGIASLTFEQKVALFLV